MNINRRREHTNIIDITMKSHERQGMPETRFHFVSSYPEWSFRVLQQVANTHSVLTRFTMGPHCAHRDTLEWKFAGAAANTQSTSLTPTSVLIVSIGIPWSELLLVLQPIPIQWSATSPFVLIVS